MEKDFRFCSKIPLIWYKPIKFTNPPPHTEKSHLPISVFLYPPPFFVTLLSSDPLDNWRNKLKVHSSSCEFATSKKVHPFPFRIHWFPHNLDLLHRCYLPHYIHTLCNITVYCPCKGLPSFSFFCWLPSFVLLISPYRTWVCGRATSCSYHGKIEIGFGREVNRLFPWPCPDFYSFSGSCKIFFRQPLAISERIH